MCPNVLINWLLIVEDHLEGYPRFTAFIDSVPKSIVARKYSLLYSKLLLHHQVRPATLEQNLHDMDHKDPEAYPLALRSRKRDEAREMRKTRKDLMLEIDLRMKDYGKYCS